MHTPVRYAWDQMHAYLQLSVPARSVLGPLIRWQLHALRQWDQLSAQRVDQLIANSRLTARRIRNYWGREASVIYPPPLELERFRWNADRDDVYLWPVSFGPLQAGGSSGGSLQPSWFPVAGAWRWP